MSTQTEPNLVTQIDFARAGQITPQMKEVWWSRRRCMGVRG